MSKFEDFSTELVHRPEPPEAQPIFHLEVIEGPATGSRFEVDPAMSSRLLIGHFPTCGVRLDDRSISRRHATLDIVGQRLRITDLDSTNGTYVDGTAVAVAFLAGGETVRLGTTALRVTRGEQVRPPVPEQTSFGRVIGGSLAMRRLYGLCERLAASDVPVLIEGETGTGKEALAEALHEQGPRAQGPFVVFDCTAVPAEMMESELFGHERGAFTGAIASRRGVFELADGGTLLIDEIGDLDASLQTKMLRVLERKEVRRIGADKATPVDVRVLVTTRRDLDKAVHRGEFRDDLMHRIAVARVELPPLRERHGDIRRLAHHFWVAMGESAEKLSPDLIFRWEAHSWPGNVRELRNTVARHLALGDLAPPPAFTQNPKDPPPPDVVDRVLEQDHPFPRARGIVLADFERRYIERMLSKHGGDVGRAAAASGIGRRYFNLIRSRRPQG